MVTISPFKALRPAAEMAKQVASRPYDVLNSKEAKTEAQGNNASFLHITKSEIDLADNIDTHAQEVYDKAKENLVAFISRKILFRESKPCYNIYELVMYGKSQTGLVCGSSVDDYENGLIKKHEFTRPEKEQDRINHIKTSGAQSGNVFLAYRNVAEVDALINKWKEKSPVYNFTANDNIQHTIWIVNDDATIEKISTLFKEQVPCTYIADGHHRAASAAKVRAALGSDAEAGANIFLTTLFPSDQLYIMDYNRVVTDLNGLSDEEFLSAIKSNFAVEKADKAFSPAKLHQIGMYLNKQWYRLTANENSFGEDPIGILDISIL